MDSAARARRFGAGAGTGDNSAMADPAILTPDSMREEKRAVAGNSVVAAIGITALKIVVGVSTGSLGIL